jgi:hypothetical protein
VVDRDEVTEADVLGVVFPVYDEVKEMVSDMQVQ